MLKAEASMRPRAWRLPADIAVIPAKNSDASALARGIPRLLGTMAAEQQRKQPLFLAVIRCK
jgi:hypothetical protein